MACEDQVNIPLDEAEPMVVVDAWLTNTSDTQKINVVYSRPYFDNELPDPVINAEVSVIELNENILNEDGSFSSTNIESYIENFYEFTDSNQDGTYEWIPSAGSSFGKIGKVYALQVQLENGNLFESFTQMDSVPVIDSITFEYNKKNPGFESDWYYAEFWSRDLPGTGNTYWIKTFKNHVLYDEPEEINIAYDAGGSAGAEVDSLIFIQPIRIAINDFGDDAAAASPYIFGDTLKVELHSVSEEAWFFLYRVIDETSPMPSFAQLFANPLSNVPTNIAATNNEEQVLGFFNVAAVSSLEVIMNEDNVVDRVPD